VCVCVCVSLIPCSSVVSGDSSLRNNKNNQHLSPDRLSHHTAAAAAAATAV
jgi:hypothetical protein